MSLATLTQAQLDAWVAQAKLMTIQGQLPDYIPQLAQVNSRLLAVQVSTGSAGQDSGAGGLVSGDFAHPFVLMSVVKPFLLLFLLEQLGPEVIFQRVGMDPSDYPFHSIAQLKLDQGRPRNPMINSGAIALTALLPASSGNIRCEGFRRWLNHHAHAKLVLNQKMLASVQSLPNETNRAIADLLFHYGFLDHVELALDTYNHLCCLSGTIADLAQLGLLLTQPHPAISPRHQRIVSALMLTCGVYEASGKYAVKVGLPMKSGVSGALLAIVPKQGAIACYGPAIDPIGNSVGGLFLVEHLSRSINLSIF
jgi:glutaminase